MALQVGIVLPSEADRERIAKLNSMTKAFREDQVEHCESLLRSWRIFQVYDALPLINKAIRRTLRDRP